MMPPWPATCWSELTFELHGRSCTLQPVRLDAAAFNHQLSLEDSWVEIDVKLLGKH